MKKISIYIIFVLISTMCFICLGCESSNKDKNLYKTKIGNIIVWNIMDSKTEESTDIFKGNDKLVKETYPNGKYTSYVNFFVVKTPRSINLIDTGLGNVDMKTTLSSVGVTPDEIDSVYITHIHPETVGGLIKEDKAVFPNSKIYVSFSEDEYILGKKDDDPNKILYKKLEKIYGKKITNFRSDAEDSRSPITSIASYGHTGGHTLYRIESKHELLYILGGIFTDLNLQTKDPKISSTTDDDQERATSARQDILDLIESEEYPTKCTGTHFPFTGIAKIEKVKNGEYKYTLEQ